MAQQTMFPVPGGVVDLGPLQGASGARKLEVVGSSVYASKSVIPNRPYTLVSETVCAELAILLDLPIPGYQRITFENKLWFGLEYRPDHHDFKSGMESNLTNIDVLPGIFAFDVLVCNFDRNRRNLVFQKVSPALERYRVVMIDHSHALGGDKASTRDFLASVQGPQAYLQYWPELRATIASSAQFEPLLRKAEGLKHSDLVEIVGAVPAEWRPSPDESSRLIDFLLKRASNLRDLMSQTSSLFPNLS